MDELSVEELDEYKERVGRWGRDALTALQAPGRRFFAAVRISYATRKRLVFDASR